MQSDSSRGRGVGFEAVMVRAISLSETLTKGLGALLPPEYCMFNILGGGGKDTPPGSLGALLATLPGPRSAHAEATPLSS